MSMTADLRDFLKSKYIAGGSIFRDERIQGSPLPAVVIQTITDPRTALMKGESPLRDTQLQVDIWADSRGAADEIAEAVLASRPVRAVIGGTNFRRIFVDDAASSSERPSGSPATIYRTRLDLTVWWQPVS